MIVYVVQDRDDNFPLAIFDTRDKAEKAAKKFDPDGKYVRVMEFEVE
jgi:hypothetical protein